MQVTDEEILNMYENLGIIPNGESLEEITGFIHVGDTKDFVYKNTNYRIHRYYMCIEILDMTNAGKRGKEVSSLSFSYQNESSSSEIIYLPFENFHKIFVNNSIGEFSLCSDFEKIHISFRKEKSNKYINPDISIYKKLTEKPKKWTILHVVRALLNNQFKNLKCEGVYTDDYAFDASVNYGKGELKNVREFCEKIIRGHWSVYESESTPNEVHVNHFHFDNNSFVFCL